MKDFLKRIKDKFLAFGVAVGNVTLKDIVLAIYKALKWVCLGVTKLVKLFINWIKSLKKK